LGQIISVIKNEFLGSAMFRRNIASAIADATVGDNLSAKDCPPFADLT
jgi:hypothetical protein